MCISVWTFSDYPFGTDVGGLVADVTDVWLVSDVRAGEMVDVADVGLVVDVTDV